VGDGEREERRLTNMQAQHITTDKRHDKLCPPSGSEAAATLELMLYIVLISKDVSNGISKPMMKSSSPI
jgi:hypothetical protein